ncbi:MAG: hypothetical protein CMI95_06115 [Pelagibacteraceae bacterium]|nr:hypothetical protein [Pelagibacteraceae bacterium]|tara:strand:+ start:12242 stop:12517 length:276 start_codon:yes stop_codon:yes gene_type:complete
MNILATSIVILAFALCWAWIELSLLLLKKLSKKDQFNSIDKSSPSIINKINFIWYLRLLAIMLLFMIFMYMYHFNNINFQKVIQYCLGIIE